MRTITREQRRAERDRTISRKAARRRKYAAVGA